MLQDVVAFASNTGAVALCRRQRSDEQQPTEQHAGVQGSWRAAAPTAAPAYKWDWTDAHFSVHGKAVNALAWSHREVDDSVFSAAEADEPLLLATASDDESVQLWRVDVAR